MTAGRPRPEGMPWRTARAFAAQAAGPLPTEQLPVGSAVGRVLATPAAAAADLPGADLAAVDGFAVAGVGPWRMTQGRLAAGEAARVTTGAAVPAGARAVIAHETATVDGALVTGPIGSGSSIRRAGEDVRAGDVLAPAGRTITPALAGLLLQGGVSTVSVRRRPRVMLLISGDWVAAARGPGMQGSGMQGAGPDGAGAAPERGEAGEGYDVSGPMVESLVAASGGVVSGVRVARGGSQALSAALQEAGSEAEIVAVSGSSSAGRREQLRQAIEAVGGELVVDRVACRPGNPQVLASLPSGRWLVGLPGNPYAGLVACLTLLQPLLRSFSGLPPVQAGSAPVPTEAGSGPAPRVSVSGETAGDTAPGIWVPRLPVTGDARLPGGMTRLMPVLVRGDHAVVVLVSRPASLAGAAASDAVAVLEEDWVSGAAADLLPWGGGW